MRLPSASAVASKAMAHFQSRVWQAWNLPGPGDLTFFSNPRYAPALRETHASAVILPDDGTRRRAHSAIPQPYLSFAQALVFFPRDARPQAGRIQARWSIPTLSLGAGASASVRWRSSAKGPRRRPHRRSTRMWSIGSGAQIGDDCVLHARVSIRERVHIGNRVVVQDGAVIGSDGFGFARRADGTHDKIPQHRRSS